MCVSVITTMNVVTASLPKSMGSMNSASIGVGIVGANIGATASFFGNNGPVGSGGAGMHLLNLFAGSVNNNNLINPGGIGNLFDINKPKVFDIFQPVSVQPLFGSNVQVIKPYDTLGDSQKSIKAVQDNSKKFFDSMPSQIGMIHNPQQMIVNPNIVLTLPIAPNHPIVPTIPITSQVTTDTPPVPDIPSFSNSHDGDTHCEWCIVKGIYYGAKHVIVTPSELQKPANLINKHIGKAFIAGEIVGGAIAGGYYGSQGVDVGDKLKQ